jgi:hypothetical protein
MTMQTASFILGIATALSVLVAARHPVAGWVGGIVLQIPWVIYSLMTGQAGFVISSAVFVIAYAVNLRVALARRRSPASPSPRMSEPTDPRFDQVKPGAGHVVELPNTPVRS